MAYNPNAPANDEFLADFPPEMREQLRAIINDKIVNAQKINGLSAGNANGNVPISNGTKNVNLNADLLDGKDSTDFATATHTHSVATTNDNGFMSNTDKAKLDGIASGAEVNQNAFANVKVGSTTIQADAKQDTLELAAGTNITLTPDATNDKVTVAAPNVLPLAGGKMTGIITSNTNANCDATSSTRIEETLSAGKDKNNLDLGSDFYSAVDTEIFHGIRTVNPNITGGSWSDIRLHVNTDKKRWISADYHSNLTDGTTDNSNHIPTTAFIHRKYLSLGGGTLTGNVTISKSSPHIFLKDTVIARNTAPSANYTQVEINGLDKNGANTWGLYHKYLTTKQHEISLICYKGTTTDNTWTNIAVGYDASGNWYTYAPTPAVGDNSNNIATTAFVHNYLPLSGGTMTGNLAISGSSLINVGSTLHDEGRGGWIAATGSGIRVASEQFGISNSGAYIDLNGRSYANASGTFTIVANSSAGAKSLVGNPDGTLTWGGKEVMPQKVYRASVSNQNVANNTEVELGSQFTVPKGTYIICVTGLFNTGTTTTGVREIGFINKTSNVKVEVARVGGYNESEYVCVSAIDAFSSNTNIKLYARQTCGSTKTFTGSINFLRVSSDNLV